MRLYCQQIFFLLLFSIKLAMGALTNRPRKVASELLLPLNSTTALMCEPVFSGEPSTAIWYRDGIIIATVNSEVNVVYENRPHTPEQQMPNVGFLIISNIKKEDEGEYWCRKKNGEAGEVFKLRVAFVDPIEPEKNITVEPTKPSVGSPLMAHCPIPNAYPRPTVSWLLEGEPLHATSSESVVFANGTLYIPQLNTLQLGRLECIVNNFAGKVSTYIQLHASRTRTDGPVSHPTKCAALFRSSVLWFLLGCLVTSSAVLIYLLCVLVLLRPNQHRLTLRPSMWLRSHPLLGPGFRKAIVPTPDYLVPPRPVNEA